MIFVDGVDIGDVTDVALRDRRMLSADGIFVVVATISEQDGSSVAEPEVIFRGVPFVDEADKLARPAARRASTARSRARPRRTSARSTCSSRCSTTTSPRSSTRSSGAARWCCRSSSRSELRAVAIVWIAALLLLGAAAPASATDVSVDGTTLRIVDDRGEVNVLSVQFNGLGYDVYDDTSRLRAGAGCSAFEGRRHHVSCIAPLAVEKLQIDAGAGADFVLLDAIEVPVEATGGAGDDLIEGGGSADRLEGGAGNDAIIARPATTRSAAPRATT